MTDIFNPTQAEKDALSATWEAWEKRKPAGYVAPTPEQQAAAKDYWTSVFSSEPKQSPLWVSQPTKQEMDYMEARKKVWAILQLRAAHIEDIEGRAFEWIFNDEEKAILQNIVRYFINDPASQYPLSKGLFLYGSPGTGKTEIMRAMSRFCADNDLSKAFVFCSLSHIHIEAKANKKYDPVTPNVQQQRCFDEFGRYIGPITRYGDLLDINEAIIEQRYERGRRYGQITHFIANATPNELNQALSPMISDRLRSMCTGIVFSGTSKR